MDCNVIKDLIPLYIDECCSKESADMVTEHLDNCPECKEVYENMIAPSDFVSVSKAPVKMSKINDWKASILQSILLFVSFAIITFGVWMEAKTSSSSFSNSINAFNFVVPTTGFMLSLANWYFVKFYKTRKLFSRFSLLFTLGGIICTFIITCWHYELNPTIFLDVLLKDGFSDFIETMMFFFGVGIVLTTIYCVLSKVLSNKFAKMLGKE